MDYGKTATKLVNELVGVKNIKSVTHCMTRLRFVLNDEACVDDDKIKAIKGVMGIMKKGGQYQVIIGNEVQKCYKELTAIGGIKTDSGSSNTAERKKEKLTFGKIVNNVLGVISGSMSPILPAIIGCGMIKLLVIVLGLLGVPDTNSTYKLLVILGDVGFYFLPIFLAYTTSKKFGCNPLLAMTMVAVLVHPDLIAMFAGEDAVSFLKLPVTAATYSSSVIPALLIVWIQSYIEKLVDKITPDWTKTVFKPMLVLLVMLPIALAVLAPLGAIIGNGVQAALVWLQTKAGWLTLMLFSAVMPFIVMTGMHYAFVPGAISDLGTVGFETLLLPAMLASNLAQGAAALAVTLRTKNKDLKSVGGASAASALIAGITEPALYGVNIRLKRPIIASCIGSGLAGLFIGIVKLKSYSFAIPALISIIQFISPDNGINFIYAIIAAIISVVVTFILTLVLGWEDPVDEDDEDDEIVENAANATNAALVISAPIKGNIVPLENVNDTTFSTGILGDGYAIIPSEGRFLHHLTENVRICLIQDTQ